MNIDSILNNDGYHKPNPAYKKGNGEPKFITTDDPRYAPGTTADMFFEAAKRGDLNRIGNVEDYDKYIKEGITPAEGDSFDDYQRHLANYQSFMEKGRNSLIQTISEATLGTAKAFADLFDLVTLSQLRKDSDYQNPISGQIEEWQNQIREATPIWTDPDKSILNGGLFDSSFIFSGLPSVVSSLTLLIPSKAVTFGITRGASWITRNGLRFARNLERAHKAAQLGDATEGVSTVAKINAYINGPASKTAKNIIDYGIGGFTSRLLENYQEGRQTYNDAKPVYKAVLDKMSPQERQKTIDSLRNEYGDDAADWEDNNSVANLVAQKAADETFKDDMVNAFSDMYQMYSIGKVGRALNGPSRSALNRLNKLNIKTAGMSKEAVDKLLASRTKFDKFRDKANDILFGGRTAVIAELSEGVEEAVNYIAQEEGFHFGKVLLNQEAEGNFWSDRLVDYMKSPKLYDSAFWGVMGGVIFNKTGEYANRVTQALDKIKTAKKAQKELVADKSNPIKVPTFREAFKDTELMVRKANLESNVQTYRDVQEKLNRIQDGEDLYKITKDRKLETQEEKDAAKEMLIREFRDKVLLDAMDAGNYDYSKEYLASDELKQSFVDGGHLTQEQADKIQTETLSRGDDLLKLYNKNLRNIYNAVASWGTNNDADLTEIPAEIFNIIARENINHELAAQYQQGRINRLEQANSILEQDSREQLEAEAKNYGISDFKSILDTVYKTYQIGAIDAQIRDIKAKKEHTTASGQSVLRVLEANKAILVKELEDATGTDINNSNDVQAAANILLSMRTAASVNVIASTPQEGMMFGINEDNDSYKEILNAVNKRDRKIISSLSPLLSDIFGRNKVKEGEKDTFFDEVVSAANVRDNIIKPLFDEQGNMKVLQNINAQLESNYKEIIDLKINQAFENSRIASTKSAIQARAHDLLNTFKDAKGMVIGTRASSLDMASHLYQQLAKKYGKDELVRELDSYVKTGNHTNVFDRFNNDEQSAFESITALVKLNRPENDIALGDIYNALNYNDIYEYSKDTDVIEIIKENRRKRQEQATQSSSTLSEPISGENNSNSTNQSQTQNTSISGVENGQIEQNEAQSTPLEEGEIGEGTAIIADDDKVFGTSDVANLSDDALIEAVNKTSNYLNDSSLTPDQRAIAEADLNALQREQERRQANSSTGELVTTDTTMELTQSDIVATVDEIIDRLSESNPNNLNINDVKAITKAKITQDFGNIDEATLDELIDSSIAIVDKDLKEDGESIESRLAKNVIKLSRIAASNNITAATKEAKVILNKTFDNLLDIFNRHLSNGKIDGKYIIPLEPLLRYARSITNNEYDAQEMYDSFTKLIAEHPDKYLTIKGKVLDRNNVIAAVTETVEERRQSLNKTYNGNTFDIRGMLSTLKDDDTKKKIKTAIKALRPGDKVYVTTNYDNEKPMDKKDGMFVGGIDFIIVDGEGNKITIAKAPAPMYTNNGGFGEMQDGWYYQFPFAVERNEKEYPIQLFFKDLFTSDSENASKFRDTLRQYETLTRIEAYDKKIGEPILKEAYDYLKAFADEANYNLSDFEQHKAKGEKANANRIRHLARLDVYAQDKLNLDAEDIRYETDDKDFVKDSYKKSIDAWFDKMIESSDTRDIIKKELQHLSDDIYDIGVEIESVGNPALIITREENALPFTKAIADQHKSTARLAAGPSPYDTSADKSKVTVSDGTTMSLDGSNTIGRTVVTLQAPNGTVTYANAYPVQLNNSIFDNNVKLAAFKEALGLRLDELMDEWYRTRNSEKLEEFLDMLGHKAKETRKASGSLFVGFFRNTLPKGNGFSITYKTHNGVILSPDSKEDGETHYLTFYDSVPVIKNNVATGSKARAAVQDWVRGRQNNPAVVWNSNPNDTSTLTAFNAMKATVKDVIINSLKIRIDALNITADNDSNLNYGSFMTRDSKGNFALQVSGIVNPSKNLQQYVQKDGTILIDNLGQNNEGGTFSDFILQNDLVNVTTRPIDDSNFSIFDHSDGDFGLTYTIKRGAAISPVGEIQPAISQIPLSDIVKNIINAKDTSNKNTSKAIVKAIADRIADTNSSIYNLTKYSKIINQFLHKNVIFVENFNSAIIKNNNGDVQTIPEDAYGMYIPSGFTVTINDKTNTIKDGQIIVGSSFMELLDGNTGDIIDALHHLLHENVHAFIADNDEAYKELNEKYEKELNELWDEYTRKHPNSPHAKSEAYNDLEEFIVESLTNPDLIRELNDTVADNPLNSPKKPKSLLGKLFDKLISWLSDILGKNFNVNKDSLLSKEYGIFEQAILDTKVTTSKSRNKKKSSKPQVIEGTLEFKEDEPIEDVESSPEITNLELELSNENTATANNNISIKQDTRTKAPTPRRRPKASTIASNVPTLKGALDNLEGDTYFDVKEKINNGVISIKCK